MTNLVEFDPNSSAKKDTGIFGLPFTTETARQVIIAVPWEVTCSYRDGTAAGPAAILAASSQVDLFDADVENAWKAGLAMDEIPDHLKKVNDEARKKARRYIELLENGFAPAGDNEVKVLLQAVNTDCERMNAWVQERAAYFLDQGKSVNLIGGDHSTPLGLIRELGKRHDDFGILHFDAHHDLRDAYEGFTYSHASIMFNALAVPSLSRLVQVGIRDYCEDEALMVSDSRGRVVAHYDRDINEKLYEGMTWNGICEQITMQLPDKIYISFDVDGLDPKLCPNTGTPVPGGLEFEQALYLVRHLVRTGHEILGFDVSEVAPGQDEWDANVGARLVLRLANLCTLSSGLV